MIDLDKDYLQTEYWVKEKPMHQIAEENNVSLGTIFNYMKMYDIPSRKHLTDKAKSRISDSKKGCPGARKGVKVSDETRRKMSIAKIGKYTVKSKYGGHTKIRSDGYRFVYVPTHPHATKEGYVMEHILVMEEHIGRYLKKDEVVHHKNHNRIDNSINNLQLMTFKEHASLHMRERWEQKKGVKTYQ